MVKQFTLKEEGKPDKIIRVNNQEELDDIVGNKILLKCDDYENKFNNSSEDDILNKYLENITINEFISIIKDNLIKHDYVFYFN